MGIKRAIYSKPFPAGRYLIRLCNRSNIPTATIKSAMRYAMRYMRGRTYQISVLMTNYRNGDSSWDANTLMFPPDCPTGLGCDGRIICQIAGPSQFPTYRRAGGGYAHLEIDGREEALVYLMAHEFRHVYQGVKYTMNCRNEKLRAIRDEADADKYALRVIRKWRAEADQ